MGKIMTIQEAGLLLDKYYEGFTSVDEEKLLYAFLSQKNLPEQFEADKAILSYFASHKKKSKIQVIPLLRWTGIAASIAIGISLAGFLMFGKSDSYAYIDGKKITDMEQIKEHALASIRSWNNSDNDTNLDTDDLIIQQLQLFVN